MPRFAAIRRSQIASLPSPGMTRPWLSRFPTISTVSPGRSPACTRVLGGRRRIARLVLSAVPTEAAMVTAWCAAPGESLPAGFGGDGDPASSERRSPARSRRVAPSPAEGAPACPASGTRPGGGGALASSVPPRGGTGGVSDAPCRPSGKAASPDRGPSRVSPIRGSGSCSSRAGRCGTSTFAALLAKTASVAVATGFPAHPVGAASFEGLASGPLAIWATSSSFRQSALAVAEESAARAAGPPSRASGKPGGDDAASGVGAAATSGSGGEAAADRGGAPSSGARACSASA